MAIGVSAKRIFLDYSRWCTVVCLNKIATSARWLSIVFTIIFFCMLGLFIFISTNLIIKYFKYPSSTELTIDVKSQAFPRFSFCNENPLKRSVVDSDPAFAEIAKLMRQFEQFEQKTITNDDFGIGTTPLKMQRLSRTRMMLRLLMHHLSDADRIRGGYSFTELVSECTFAGRTCSSSDFTSFLHPDYGVCYTFSKERNITKAGSTQGLRLLMTVNQDSPRFNIFDFLPTSDSSNIRGVLHQPDDYLDFSNNGFKIAAKTQTSIAFRRIAHSRSPAPYDNCTRHGEMSASDYYANFTYAYTLCQSSCLQRLAAQFCGCVDPLHLKGDEHKYCSTPTDMLCLVNLPLHFSTVRRVCDCHPPCDERALEMTVTYGVYPSAKYRVAAGTLPQREALLRAQGGGRTGEGDEDDDDWDGTATTSMTTTVSESSTTTTSEPPTSTYCPPTLLTDEEARALLKGDEIAFACRSKYAYFYNNPKFTVIQGFPCLSKKPCRTCIMFTQPMPEWDWPCQYVDHEECVENNRQVSTSFSCVQFFRLFDFIPTGVNIPGIMGWQQGNMPYQSTCTSLPAASSQRQNCWLSKDCKRYPTTSNLQNLDVWAEMYLDEMDFWRKLNVNATWTPCDLSSAARDFARRVFNLPASAQNGRRRRSAMAMDSVTTENVTVDLPGYGSCEYANRNFKNAADCIKWYGRNGLIVEMYYESLEEHLFTQAATYTLVTVLSDVAGHAGLWLGISVVSIVEIFALIFMCANKLICGKNMSPVEE